ncbi:HAD-IC family P-type ATPase [Rickettsiaceae bacterium]|nr:HAD-IC family P-type ATPase [Rickettsiaceae bacterium]
MNTALNALRKMSFRYLLHTPMLALVFIVACLATILLLKEINYPTGHIALYSQMVFWVWMIIFFSTLADSYAESKMSAKPHLNLRSKAMFVKKIASLNHLEHMKQIEYSKVRSGDLIILERGNVVPFDGVIMHGACYANETNVTGGLGNIPKSIDGDNILTAGSKIVGNQQIVMRVSFAKKVSFFARARKILKSINRQSLPSEVALQRIILGLSVLFVSVIFTVWVIARYSGFTIPPIYLLDLIVILLPTTISGLQHAVILSGKVKLENSGIIINDHVALDSVVDVNIILMDKTGTLTVGKREMNDFSLISEKIDEQKCMDYLFLSSLHDVTVEGVSVREFAAKKSKIKKREIDHTKYKYLPFLASEPISGCDYDGLKIRKGGIGAIANYLGKEVDDLPEPILRATKIIAVNHGTPILLVVNKEIVGVVHLRDRLRKGVIKQLQKLHDDGVDTALITGDNAFTAEYVAQKLGIKEIYTEVTPEKKLQIVKKLQQKGYVVAMCGDGVNDSLALAQADIGFTFQDTEEVHSIMSGNVVSCHHDLSALVDLKNVCKKMTVRRGALTVFSLASDVAKYFVIVPALFTTAFPPLAVLNFMNFRSLESVVLASVMFNALVILILTPIIFKDYNKLKSQYSLWTSILLYGAGGLISPFIFIKLIEIFIHWAGLL